MAEEKKDTKQDSQSYEVEVDSANSFFDELDRQLGVSGGFFSDDSGSDMGLGNNMPSHAKEDDDKSKEGNGETNYKGKVEDLTKELDTVKKQYGDSSKEAKKLNSQLEVLRPLAPILEKARQNPEHVARVLSSLNDETPVSVKDRLGLDEDFEFDMDEAITDPKSDSGKAFLETVSAVVRSQMNAGMQESNAAIQQEIEKERFMRESKLSDEEFKEMERYANEKKLEYSDILYLMKREEREKEIAKTASEETLKKLKGIRSRPHSLASAGSQSQSVDDDISIFNKIFPNAVESGGFFD